MKTNRTPLDCVPAPRRNVRRSIALNPTGFLLSFWLLMVGAAGCSADSTCPEGSTEQQGTCVLAQTEDVPQNWVPSLGLDSHGEQGDDAQQRTNSFDGESTTDVATPDSRDGIAQQPIDSGDREESDLRSSRAPGCVDTHSISQNDKSGHDLELMRFSATSEIHPDVNMLHAPLLSRPLMRRK